MRFVLDISTDSDAFTNFPSEEAARILEGVANLVRDTDPGDRADDHPFILRDTNGVRVGTAHWIE